MYSEHPTDLLPPPPRGGGGTAGGRPVRLVLLFGEGEAAGESPAALPGAAGTLTPVRLALSHLGEGEAAGESPADLLLPSGGGGATGESPEGIAHTCALAMGQSGKALDQFSPVTRGLTDR